LASPGVLDIGWVEADNVVLTLARTGGTVPILIIIAFGYFFADALTGM